MENKNYKAFIVPMVAVAIFTLVIFGAGYAFFAATVNTTAIANISTQLPDSGTTFVVDSDACSITVNAADMVQAQAGTYNGTSTCHLNVTLTGAAGVSCNYNVMLVQKGTSNTYVPSANIPGGSFEFSGQLSGASTIAETQMNTLVNTTPLVAGKTISISSGTSATQNYTFTEKWYNLNIDQSKYGSNQSRANEKYEYELKVDPASVVC